MSQNDARNAVGGGKGRSRRAVLRGGAAAGVAAIGGIFPAGLPAAAPDEPYRAHRGRIRQSVVHWCFNKRFDVPALARMSKQMGIRSVELCPVKDWPILTRLGLECAITSTHGFRVGFANPDGWAECIDALERKIDVTAEAGFKSVISFSGFLKGGMQVDTAIDNMVEGFKKVVGHAEKKKVNICLEMLNTRVDEQMKGHPGYMCDKIEYALEVCKRVGSPRMKILFDIYHVQIMQGDVIVRLRECKEYIGHYHTAGVPGRREIDDDQEINYSGVMKAIAATGYRGFVGQEFIPTWSDHAGALRHAVEVCDV